MDTWPRLQSIQYGVHMSAALTTAALCVVIGRPDLQGRLNQLDVVVALRLRQVQYLVDGRLPQDLSMALVFNSIELTRLRRRIDVSGWRVTGDCEGAWPENRKGKAREV